MAIRRTDPAGAMKGRRLYWTTLSCSLLRHAGSIVLCIHAAVDERANELPLVVFLVRFSRGTFYGGDATVLAVNRDNVRRLICKFVKFVELLFCGGKW